MTTFSIIYETENLGSLKLENIYPSLDSLASQSISPSQANEFFIMDTGDVPGEVLEQLREKYPWIQIRKIDASLGYYEAKTKGAKMATGDILLLADSDCIYVRDWVKDMLSFFNENNEATIVAGETSTRIKGPYEMAIAMSYFFPRYTNKAEPYEDPHYFCNNVGFRRDFLLTNPIPPALPLFRGNCLVHAFTLRTLRGKKIWKHPGARALHEPPEARFSFWRLLLLGRDRVVRKKIERDLAKSAGKQDLLRNKAPIFSRLLRAFQIPQIYSVLKEEPKRCILLPLAIPIALVLSLIFWLGVIITLFQRDYLLNAYNHYEEKRKGA